MDFRTTKQMLNLEDKIDVELKKIMMEKKNLLPFLRNQEWKKVEVETE